MNKKEEINIMRRKVVLAAGAGLVVGATGTTAVCVIRHEQDTKKVGANEDLMREHGILRRALLVYRQTAAKLLQTPTSFDESALNKTAQLFRTFGEDYHERKLEEAYIFPAIRKAGGRAADYADILQKQHNLGREITDYILSATSNGTIGSVGAELFAHTLIAFDAMYENHATREDTIVFPAWKKVLSGHELNEMNEKFEEIERQQFGKDGFEDAENKISAIEKSLGYSDISQFNTQPPTTNSEQLH